MRAASLAVVIVSLAALVNASSLQDFSATRAAAAGLPQLHSLVVSHRGVTVFEHHAPRYSATRLANIKSASKSVISALVGIAIARKLIPGVGTPIVRWFPELRNDPDKRKQAITIENLLTMQSGLESTSSENYGQWVRSRNWVRHALAQPMVSDPGTSMEYSTGTSHILSAILTKVSRRSTHQFATDVLAKPLGMTLARWQRDPQGIYFGGNEMLMTPRQMLAFGELYLNRGRVRGQQVVPAHWVDTSCVPRTRSRWDPDREYGYGWWVQDFVGHRACFAWGYGGQYIMVFRELDLVVVATSATTVSDERRGYRRQLFDLIRTTILPEVIPIPPTSRCIMVGLTTSSTLNRPRTQGSVRRADSPSRCEPSRPVGELGYLAESDVLSPLASLPDAGHLGWRLPGAATCHSFVQGSLSIGRRADRRSHQADDSPGEVLAAVHDSRRPRRSVARLLAWRLRFADPYGDQREPARSQDQRDTGILRP
jgi:CubicO group peptidase (beta-lactamase class C family)